MKFERCYILLGRFNRDSASGDGSSFWKINLREILGGLYDKYNRFNLKLEGYHARVTNSAALANEVQFLQVAGFNWLSGYDTNVEFSRSRVAGIMNFDHLTINNDYFRGIIYPSNIGTMTFSRQNDPNIIMELFATDPDLTAKVPLLFGDEGVNYLFSVTCVGDQKQALYREPEIIENMGQLVLNTANAVPLEAFRRAVRWTVDLSQLIDRDTYSKHSKFALTTKMIHINDLFIANNVLGATVLMSGLDWYCCAPLLNSTYTGSTVSFNTYHQAKATTIAVIATGNGDRSKETFIDNVFYKPASPIVNLTLTYNTTMTLDLISSTGAIAPFYYIFSLVPVDD